MPALDKEQIKYAKSLDDLTDLIEQVEGTVNKLSATSNFNQAHQDAITKMECKVKHMDATVSHFERLNFNERLRMIEALCNQQKATNRIIYLVGTAALTALTGVIIEFATR
jgi:predicted ATP-binding protein involved in virulence